MQGANGRQYKREMASFEMGSENASAMAGSVLRDERAQSEGDRDSGRREEGIAGGRERVWQRDVMRGGREWLAGSEKRKRSGACHVRNGDDSFVCRAVSFISDESNSIARAPGDRAAIPSLRRNVIGWLRDKLLNAQRGGGGTLNM